MGLLGNEEMDKQNINTCITLFPILVGFHEFTNPWVMDNNYVSNIIQIEHDSKELWPGHRF